MRINVIGAGPAGLYVAILMKRADPRREILVVEREAEASEWNVEPSDIMRAADYASYKAIANAPPMLLDILRRRCAELGVDVACGHEVTDPAALADADLLVGADGAESVVRSWRAGALSSNGSRVAGLGADAVRAGPAGNVVLVGDAAHVAAGVEHAIEDAIALTEAFARHRDVAPALAAYETERPQMAGSAR